MTTLREELQKIIMKTAISLESKKAAPVNPKTANNLVKIFGLSFSCFKTRTNFNGEQGCFIGQAFTLPQATSSPCGQMCLRSL